MLPPVYEHAATVVGGHAHAVVGGKGVRKGKGASMLVAVMMQFDNKVWVLLWYSILCVYMCAYTISQQYVRDMRNDDMIYVPVYAVCIHLHVCIVCVQFLCLFFVRNTPNPECPQSPTPYTPTPHLYTHQHRMYAHYQAHYANPCFTMLPCCSIPQYSSTPHNLPCPSIPHNQRWTTVIHQSLTFKNTVIHQSLSLWNVCNSMTRVYV